MGNFVREKAQADVDAEINRLGGLQLAVPDGIRDLIDIQLLVLSDRMSGATIAARWGAREEALHAAQSALAWLHGEAQDPPTQDWNEFRAIATATT